MGSTYAEAVAFVTGYDAARGGSMIPAFQRWLADRNPGHATIRLADLVLVDAGLAGVKRRSKAEDAKATTHLFDRLDEYLETRADR